MATVNLKSFPFPEDAICPKCKHEIRLYDPAGSEFCVCPNCHSFLRFIDDFAKDQKQVSVIKQQPVIPLGSEGILKGISYKVIAYSEKKEHSNPYAWREYLLYNYEKGYANLSEYDGHWSLVAGKNFYPKLDGSGKNNWDFVQYEGITYSIYNKYTAVVTALVGEFDWDPLSEKRKTTEFIAPPYIIFKEQDGTGTSRADLYLGEYIEAALIAAAFKIEINLFPAKIGIGANEFSTHYSRWYTVSRVTGIIIIALLAIQLIIMFLKPEKVLLEHDFAISYDTTKVTDDFKSFATPRFKIADVSSAIGVDIGSAVDNNWLEATITLVNEQTNQTWEVTEGIEYYHGYEDGENWTEGSQQTTVVLSSIPAGTYHLNVYPASGDRYRNNLWIRVTANITLWMNLLLTCLALCIYPFYCWVRMRNFEKQRWMNSDYSPYEANE